MLDHSTLPSVANAKLPETYERAKTALAECSSIDECQSWADKAEALASYAKMSDDNTLRKYADRIQSRAISRCGELLRQIKIAHGANQNISAGGDTNVTRKSAAADAGLSPRQRNTAIRVSNVPKDEFERLVESDNPPTITQLAAMGTKKQLVDLKGRDPNHFNQAMHFVGGIEYYLKECRQYDVENTVDILTDSERSRLRAAINEIDAIHDLIMTRI